MGQSPSDLYRRLDSGGGWLWEEENVSARFLMRRFPGTSLPKMKLVRLQMLDRCVDVVDTEDPRLDLISSSCSFISWMFFSVSEMSLVELSCCRDGT
mmetsp:Transcript_9444/g.17809  ORF Transcript_9444/g.17809 Transcript_9444/m.17809 type:complete len:97 (-) Transcript_9444:234-524(-)